MRKEKHITFDRVVNKYTGEVISGPNKRINGTVMVSE